MTSEWVGIIAIKTERTQIPFLSDVLVAVASLDLKVPNTSSRYRNSPVAVVGKLSFRSTHGSRPRVRKGLIQDFAKTRPPDYCLIICKVDLLYRFRVNNDFISRTLRSSMKTRLEPESPFTN